MLYLLIRRYGMTTKPYETLPYPCSSLTRSRFRLPLMFTALFVNISLLEFSTLFFDVTRNRNGGSLGISRAATNGPCMSSVVDKTVNMPRLVRRRPITERIQAYLNPLDFLLWLSEELDSSDWDQWQKERATTIGFAFNVIFLIARANSGPSTRTKGDDVFGEDESYNGWLAWFVCFLYNSATILIVERLMRSRQLLLSTFYHSSPS